MQTPMINSPHRSSELGLTSLPKVVPLLLVTCLAIVTGCRDDDPSRYPSVAVPGYELPDYVSDLSHPNPEIVFNAVCLLTPEAGDLGKALNGARTEPPSEAYRTAQAVHQKMLPLLQSRDPRIVAVSLRFFQYFGSTYQDKAGLITPISHIQSPHPLVQFEQVVALTTLATNTTRLPAPLLHRLLHSPTWLVSRTSYQLINKLQDEPLRAELLARYPKATEEREKLLILSAFSLAPGPKAIELLQQELLSSNQEKIRQFAGSLLAYHLAIPGVGEWLATNYHRLSPDSRHAVIKHCMRSEEQEVSGAELVRQFLIKGYQPEEEFRLLLGQLFKDAPEPLPAHLQRLDQAIRAHAALGAVWNSGRAERAEAKAHFAALEKEFPALAEELTAKAQAMFAKHKIPAEKQRQYLAGLAALDSLKP
jgi:hypothetical protein